MIRRAVAGLLFVGLLAGGMRVPLLRLLLPPHRPPDKAGPLGGVDRKPLRLANDPTPPDVLAFLEQVRARTERGEQVSLLMAWPHEGWGYTYWRASYVLAGRRVLPPMNTYDYVESDAVALWRQGWGDPRYDLVWSDEKAALLRKRR